MARYLKKNNKKYLERLLEEMQMLPFLVIEYYNHEWNYHTVFPKYVQLFV